MGLAMPVPANGTPAAALNGSQAMQSVPMMMTAPAMSNAPLLGPFNPATCGSAQNVGPVGGAPGCHPYVGFANGDPGMVINPYLAGSQPSAVPRPAKPSGRVAAIHTSLQAQSNKRYRISLVIESDSEDEEEEPVRKQRKS